MCFFVKPEERLPLSFCISSDCVILELLTSQRLEACPYYRDCYQRIAQIHWKMLWTLGFRAERFDRAWSYWIAAFGIHSEKCMRICRDLQGQSWLCLHLWGVSLKFQIRKNQAEIAAPLGNFWSLLTDPFLRGEVPSYFPFNTICQGWLDLSLKTAQDRMCRHTEIRSLRQALGSRSCLSSALAQAPFHCNVLAVPCLDIIKEAFCLSEDTSIPSSLTVSLAISPQF